MRSSLRLDAKLVSLLTYAGILLFNTYALFLYFDGQLILYIHPRYVLFTAALNAVSALACTVGLVLTALRMGEVSSGTGPENRVAWRPSLTALVAVLVLAAAYMLPARTLSSDTADQRGGNNFNSSGAQVSGASPGSGGTLALFGAATSRLTIADWASAFNLKASPDSYTVKEVDVIGFVFQPEGAPEDIFYVSRFRVTCCVIDAQPFGLPVRAPGWRERFEEDSWVRVTGSFAKTDLDVAEPVVIEPRRIEPTEQPEQPYVVE